MLPVVVYNIDPEDYDLLMDQLQEGAQEAQVELKIELNTMEARAAQNAVKNEKNIMLLITGIDNLADDKERLGLKLGRMAMNQNRDNYAVFITRNRRNVEDVLCLCMRPAGVMAVPLDKRRIAAVFRQILSDFYRLDNQNIPNGKYIVCKVGGALHRLNTDEIVFVQALDKKIDICTAKQSIQVYKTMGEIGEILGEQFIKCHRSYLINLMQITRVDTVNMIVMMRDGVEIPLSRSCKDAVCQAFVEREEMLWN